VAVGAVGVGLNCCAQSDLSFKLVYIPQLLKLIVNLQISFFKTAVAVGSISLFMAVKMCKSFCLLMCMMFGDNIE
jgi:hypothetical protein